LGVVLARCVYVSRYFFWGGGSVWWGREGVLLAGDMGVVVVTLMALMEGGGAYSVLG
jgi:hypothetical protein